MKISSYIYTLITLVVVSVLVLGFIAVVAIDRTNYLRTRADLAAAQVTELIDLARSGNHLSEHVAEHFIFKNRPSEEITHGLTDIKNALNKLRTATTNETSHLRYRDEVIEEAEDGIRLEKLESTFVRAKLQIDEMLQLEKEDNSAEAITRLESGFNKQTMVAFDTVVTEAIEEEDNEATGARKAADEYWTWLRRLVLIATGILFSATLMLSFALMRRINRPIWALTEGVNAFAKGRFDHRVPISAQDELGFLAKSINQMAQSLEENRAAQSNSQNELERKVEERTVDVLKKAEALDKANARLAQLNRNRTQFLADISHEVRTPLTTLRGEAELALRLKDKSIKPYRMALAKVLSVSETIGKLVDDLLFLARSESDSVRFENQSVDLAAIANTVLDDATMLAKTKNIVIRKMFDEKPGLRAEGDPTRIKQALLIAIDNAIKFSPPGKNVDFVMSTTGPMADFIIRDFGPGVAEEDLPFVFERFYRSKHEAGLPGGFGLGLSIAKWIVDKHGGAINLKCQNGRRTELKISLPLIYADGLSER
jgi:two-component system, OmpR family, sensor kinase